jgi:hypothetical protein
LPRKTSAFEKYSLSYTHPLEEELAATKNMTSASALAMWYAPRDSNPEPADQESLFG